LKYSYSHAHAALADSFDWFVPVEIEPGKYMFRILPIGTDSNHRYNDKEQVWRGTERERERGAGLVVSVMKRPGFGVVIGRKSRLLHKHCSPHSLTLTFSVSVLPLLTLVLLLVRRSCDRETAHS